MCSRLLVPQRAFSTTLTKMAAAASKKDWSAAQYLKFSGERTRAVRDLVAQLPEPTPRRILDLGCGPGNSTAVLAARYPDASITGMDSSPDMLAQARALLPNVEFVQGDLRTFAPETTAGGAGSGGAGAPVDLLFSNAVFQWLRSEERIPTILRLMDEFLPSGGVLALQVPDNYDEPSHKAMRETALLDGPWAAYFQAQSAQQRPDLDPIEAPDVWYNALVPHCATVTMWHVVYQHVLPGPGSIVEWVKGTGLMPFLHVLPDGSGGVRDEYLAAYEKRLGEVYPRLADGKVMLRYPRLFIVATKK